MAEESHAYKIWGIDNVVYGPVELPVLVAWIKEDRVTASTWVYVEAGNQWHKAGQLPELQLLFRDGPASKPPPAYDTELMPRAPALKAGSLRRIKIFAGLSDEQLARFVHYMEIHQARQFSPVVRQGDPGDAMFLILQGEARVRMMISGKETILATLASGDFFGEISLFDHGPRSADVVANEETILLRVSAASFQKVITEAPDLAAPFLLAIGKTLTSRIRADNKRFRDTIAFRRSALDET
jgi:CRP/FNR family cyclic AMP-dependent transcriptional regulator